MYLAAGRLLIEDYRVKERDAVRRICRLVPAGTVELRAEQAARVNREQAVHKVSNLPRFNQRTESVHVHQQPMSQSEVYSLEKGTYEVVQLSYASEFAR
jgi:hypothetical protein